MRWGLIYVVGVLFPRWGLTVYKIIIQVSTKTFTPPHWHHYESKKFNPALWNHGKIVRNPTTFMLGGEVNPKFFGLAAQNLPTGIRNEEPSKKLELFDGNPPVHGV